MKNKKAKKNLEKHLEMCRKIRKECDRIRDLEQKKDEYRWNHPNWFLRRWWRFYLSFDPIGPHQ